MQKISAKKSCWHAIRMAHLYEKKVYMTVNTLVKGAELKKLPAFLQPYSRGRTGWRDHAGSWCSQDDPAFLSGSGDPRQHTDDDHRIWRSKLPEKVWRDKNCTGPGALTCRIKAAEDRDRSGTGNLYPWQHVLLLFRSMPLFKHARTEKREQRAVRRSVQTALSAAGGRTYDQCKGRTISAQPEGSLYTANSSKADRSRNRLL